MRYGMYWVTLFLAQVVWAAPPSLTYQGRIVKIDGKPLEHNSVSFQFEITNDSGSCIVYREQVNGINMANSNGVFDVKIGAAHSFPSDSSFDILKSFNNSSPLSCDSGVVYNPALSDGRKLRVHFHDGTAWKQITPDSAIRSVPYAGYADVASKIGTHPASDFVLKTEVNGNASCGAGSFLTWNATTLSFGCAPGAASSGTVTDVTSENSFLTVANGTSTPTLTLNVGTGANQVAAGNDSRFTNSRIPTGTAGGDLGGLYPNPSVEKIKGVSLDAAAPTTGQVLTYDGNKWKPVTPAAGAVGTVTSIATGAGLTGGPITGSGTIGLGTGLTNFLAVSANGYIQKTGTNTYSSTIGTSNSVANSLVTRDATGASQFSAIHLVDTSTGVVTLKTQNTTASYSLKLPASQGSANQVLANDGTGSLTWSNVPAAPAASCGAGNVLTYDGSGFICVPDQIGSAGGGVASINGQSGSAQTLAVGSTGTAPGWTSSSDTHRLNIPFARDASVTAGLISKTEYDTFNGKQAALGFTPLRPSNNLSELTDAATARTNLGLGTVATYNVATGATAANNEVVLGNDSRLTDSRTPTGTASGDLTGNYPNPEIAKIKGVNLSISSLTSGQVLKYSGSAWVNGAISQAEIPNLVSDLAGKVDKSAVASCTTKQTLIYISASDTWSCQTIALDDSQITYASKTAKTFLAAPTAANGAPTFRAIAFGDLPTTLTDGLWTAASGHISRATGNVGIGVAGPVEKLEVDGKVKATQLCIGADCRAAWPTPATGTVTSITAGTGLLTGGGTPITTADTLSVDVGTTTGKILQVAAGNKLPTIDASNLTALNASQLSSGTIPAARLPAFSGDVSSSGTTLTLATVSVSKGGTGATTAAGAINNLLPSQTSQAGKFLTTDGSNVSWTLLNMATIRSTASGNPVFFNVSGSCAAGEMLTYNSSSDQISCQAYSLPTSVTDAMWTLSSGNVYRASGNVGIGTASPGQKLTVVGTIESTTGGIKFPDGSVQTTAAVSVKNQLCAVGEYLRGFDSSGNKICVALSGGNAGNSGFQQISTGHVQGCGLAADGLVKCWGYGLQGSLGNGSTGDSSIPVIVRKLDGTGLYATKVVLNLHHSVCAIQASDNKVYCWGYNNYGQLGVGDAVNSSVALEVLNLPAVQDIAGGYLSFCAVENTGHVSCWGYNGNGNLGNNTTTTSYVPVRVKLAGADLTGMSKVVASGGVHACAHSTTTSAVQVYCWGYNGYGQLGDGTTVQKLSANPVSMTALTADGVTNVIQMAAGGDSKNAAGNTCIVARTGAGTYKVYCFGYNPHGQLMLGHQTTPVTSPTASSLVGAQTNPFHVSMKLYSSCYLPNAGGTIKCIGYNGNGELGDGTATSNYLAFVNVKGIGGVGTLNAAALDVSSGNYDSTYVQRCAITATGGAACWGANSYGQLGNNTTAASYNPVGVFQ